MPYKTHAGTFQKAGKLAHESFVQDPEVQRFIDEECDYIRAPASSDDAGPQIAHFRPAPDISGVTLPEHIVAIDGSRHESMARNGLPSTRLGFVHVRPVLILMRQYRNLRTPDRRFVDPYRLAALTDDDSGLNFTLPSSNVRLKKGPYRNTWESFRARLDWLLAEKRVLDSDPESNLRTTLFRIAVHRRDEHRSPNPQTLVLPRCPYRQEPACRATAIELHDVAGHQACPGCGRPLFPSDVLRLHEEITEAGENIGALTRVMNTVEHLLPVAWTMCLRRHSPATLNSLAFFLDNPLAIFGSSAWLHACILRYLHDLNAELENNGGRRVLVLGLQKSGRLVEFGQSVVAPYAPPNTLLSVDNDYRTTYLGNAETKQGFGMDTYYGQDFIHKTPSGKVFVFNIPFPVDTKPTGKKLEALRKDIHRYPDLPMALALMQHFESDLYPNAVVPIALAHQHAAISLSPGAKALDALTRKLMRAKTP